MIEENKHKLLDFTQKENDFSRNRKLPIETTIGLILEMVLSRNMNGYSISVENFCSQADLEPASGVAFCKARQKLSWKAFEFLLDQINQDKTCKFKKQNLWQGHLTRIVDGSWITLPHTKEILKEFPQNMKNNKYLEHYPQALLVTATNLLTGQVSCASVGSSRSSEKSPLLEMIKKFEKGDLTVLDRGYFSFEVLRAFKEAQQYFVMRVKSNLLASRQLLESGKSSLIYDMNGVKVRIIKSNIKSINDNEPLFIITNLLNEEKYSDKALIELYKQRWNIETTYHRVKALLKLENFHARSINGIYQEIYANLLVISMVAMLQTTAAKQKKMDLTKRVPNFKNATEVMRRYLVYFIYFQDSSKQEKEEIAQNIIDEVAKIIYRKQPDRHYPRVSKQAPNKWTKERGEKYKKFKKLKKLLS